MEALSCRQGRWREIAIIMKKDWTMKESLGTVPFLEAC